MIKTTLYDAHVELGAKMVPFGGYEMPLSYRPITEEHQTVRENVGVFDVSHMGQFIVKGKEALNLVQTVSSNDASVLEPGAAQYSCLMTEQGTIVDDLIVYRLFDDKCADGEMAFMLVVNASNVDKDLKHIEAYNTFDTKIFNISERTSLLAIQGPNAKKHLQKHTEINLEEIPFYHFTKGLFASIPNVLISNTGYTGSGGFEIYIENKHVAAIWELLVSSEGISPIGLGARDTLRLEMGYCLYGNELNENISPCEAGLNWITKPGKTPSFLGEDLYLAKKADKKRSYLIAFILEGRRIPRNGYPILNEEDIQIGTVTSGASSPSLQIPIGMGYVDNDHRKVGTKIKIQINSKIFQAEVTKPPFL